MRPNTGSSYTGTRIRAEFGNNYSKSLYSYRDRYLKVENSKAYNSVTEETTTYFRIV